MRRRWRYFMLPLVGLVLWEGMARLVPPYLLASPSDIAVAFIQMPEAILRHSLTTGAEALVGLASATAVATVLGLMIVASPAARALLYPWMVVLQAVPVIVIAPLVLLWLGHDWVGKSFVAMLIAFFPLCLSFVRGLESVSADSLALFSVFGASRWQTLVKLRLPASMPQFFSGLRIAATLSVIGAIVGEFTGADAGLGFFIVVSSYGLETARMFAGAVASALLSLTLFWAVIVVERITWKREWSYAPDADSSV